MQYDAIVIGAGQAGPVMVNALLNQDKHVALIEGSQLGGTCLNFGCKPTKTLRASAKVAHTARRAAEYGVHTGEVSVDFPAVMTRMHRIIDGMRESFVGWIENLDNLDIYRDYAHFLSSQGRTHRLQVGDDVLEAPAVYINAGARAVIPPIDGIDDVPYLTSRDLMGLEALPEHLVIVGGSYIGLEFGQMFRRFGSDVTIIESKPRLAFREDDDIADVLKDVLTGEGVEVITNHRAQATQRTDGGVEVTISDHDSGETRTISGTHLLLAVGRRPNSDTLSLENAGVETDDNGYIVTDDRYATNVPGIYALGDVNGRGAFTHTSVQDAEILLSEERSADERYMTYAIYTDPPLGHVGLHEYEARDSGKNVLVANYPMSSVSRAVMEGRTEGHIKILVDADTERILGATWFGESGDEVIQDISNFMYTGASYKVMRDALPIHPTVAEYLPTVLGALEPLDN
jgi:pyruvate/2-oxoglutarate dehydrogenase complex dihydrolipoamide dehydrogenase (E3) component